MSAAVNDDELDGLIASWEVANYLTIAQIYLRGNALVREPLQAKDIKPRLLGHWGTSPGLNLICVHLNRLIRRSGVDAIFVAGPGHGGPAVVANVYLDGTYSEVYPEVSTDYDGLKRLVLSSRPRGAFPAISVCPRQRAQPSRSARLPSD